MSNIDLKILYLRKLNFISQKQLANEIGVSYQTVSKWENGICMPDISLLPDIAGFFNVSVDQLLGLKPINEQEYIPTASDSKTYWSNKFEYLKRTRNSLLNEDYIRFLVDYVWKIKKPVDIIDFGCGYGFLGQLLLSILPENSTYTGIDINENLLKEAERYFKNTDYKAEFIQRNIYDYMPDKKYDIAICQAFLRHTNKPFEILKHMVDSVKLGGKVICIEINREIEADGLYIDGMDFDYLCERNGMRKVWRKELETQGRDYSIGMKIPVYMNMLGLKNIDIRLNDKVNFIYPQHKNYKKLIEDFIVSESIKENIDVLDDESFIKRVMNHGLDRIDADLYCEKEHKKSDYICKNNDNLNIVRLRGLLITCGTK